MNEKRNLERQKIKDTLLPVEVPDKTDLIHTCLECLYCLLHFNEECVASSSTDLDRLKCTLSYMGKKRSEIFSLCGQSLQLFIDSDKYQIEFMGSELECMECMQSADDSQFVISTKLVFSSGIENRNSEINNMQNVLEKLKEEAEILPVVDICEKYLQVSIKNRKEEISTIMELLEMFENEAEMVLLVYSPALENIIDGNEKNLENLISVLQKLNRISQELQAKEEKIIEACTKIYCSTLETLKIEREAINYDKDFLQEEDLETRDTIDIKGKELIVTFKDLYLGAFSLKKFDLEKDIRKKNIEDSIKMKKEEILEVLKKAESGETTKEKDSEECEETFEKIIFYYESKKEKRRSIIEHKIMNEFEAIEECLQLDKKDSPKATDYSEENVAADQDLSKTEESYNRVYEVKVKEIEEDIKYKKEKINGVIQSRKSSLESIILRKKEDLERNIKSKEKEMKNAINIIKGKESDVVCSLKDIYKEVQLYKERNLVFPISNMNWKSENNISQTVNVTVRLENFIDIILEVKEEELQIMLQAKYKEIERIVSAMKKELEKVIRASEEKLEEAIKQYRRSEKLKAMEYAVSGTITSQANAYVIDEHDIFPDINSFDEYVESFQYLFTPSSKKAIVYKDNTFRSEEILKNNPTQIPLFKKHFSDLYGISNHVLKLLDVEIKSLTKILSEMNLDKAKAILHGLSFISSEKIVHDITVKKNKKAILLDIVAILKDCTSLLILGNFTDKNCDIALNLDKDCSLVYFEKTENIKKWRPTFDNIHEVAVEIGLKHFGRNGCLDDIYTKFDWAVTTVPIGPSRFERLIADMGFLEQIKFAFLELHHLHYLCRNCHFTDYFKDYGLTIKCMTKILGSKHVSETVELLPFTSGIPSDDDAKIADYVIKIILSRGALITAICLSAIIQRIKRDEVTIIISSFIIQESSIYQKMLQTFLSAFCPEKQVKFIFCKKSNCGVGACIMASVANLIETKNPELYLLELQSRLKCRNTLFSTQNFLKLLSNPILLPEAVLLAKQYMDDMKFGLPLAVVWAYYFINENIEEAENTYKFYPVSLTEVSHFVCRNISASKNIKLAKIYVQFLKDCGAIQYVRESAYRTLINLLFYKDLYEEAVTVVKECIEEKIPLRKLSHSTLTVLQDFYKQKTKGKHDIPPLSFLNEDFGPISDSDDETMDLSLKKLE